MPATSDADAPDQTRAAVAAFAELTTHEAGVKVRWYQRNLRWQATEPPVLG